MPTIEEEIEALAKKLHPKYLIVKPIERKRADVFLHDIDDKFSTEHILTVHEFGKQFEYKANSLSLLKADLKQRLIAEQKDTTDG